MARGSLHSYDQLGVSLRQMETRLGEQAQTRLTITNVRVDGQNNTVTVNLRNDGQTRIAAFDRLDVILTYFTSPTAQLTVWLPFDAAAGVANTWTLASISDDAYDPGILNPGETAELEIELSPAIQNSTPNLIVVSSETGATVSSPFSS